MRISDADRDRAASVLSDALAEGRLTPDEHSERLDAIYAAKTQADIVPIVSDLPGSSAALATTESSPAPRTYGAAPASTGTPQRMVAVFSGTARKGVWRAPQAIEAVNVFGGTDLDFREALLPSKEIHVKAICILGGMNITVPPEMHVVDDGWAFMGGHEIPPETEESASPEAPVLRITGISILGGISVKRKRRKRDRNGNDRRLTR